MAKSNFNIKPSELCTPGRRTNFNNESELSRAQLELELVVVLVHVPQIANTKGIHL